MNLDVNALAKRSWALFIEKPVEHVLAGFIVAVVGTITLGLLMGPLMVGWIRMCEKQRSGQSIQLGDLFTGFDAFVPALVSMIVAGICVSIGFVLLVLPGVALMVAWSFTGFYIALRRQGAMEALGASWKLFRAHTGPVITCVALLAVANIVASMAVVLPLVVGPLGVIFLTLAFQEMVPE